MGDQVPQLSPHAEVRKIGDLTLYIAYENTWDLVQVKCPTHPRTGWGLTLIGTLLIVMQV